MSKVMQIPKLRFQEFSDEYIVNRIESLYGNISSGKSKHIDDGEYKFYGSTGIIGTSSKYNYEGNKLLVARVGANAGSLYKVDGKYCVSDNTLIINENVENSIDYLNYTLLSYNLNRLIFGSGQPLITGGQLKDLKLYFPQLKEQEKIASFLIAVDKKIIQLQQKKTLLEQYKKGVMQKIFNQELRFRDDNGNKHAKWSDKKLGKVLSVGSGRDYKHLKKGNIPVYGTGGVMAFVDDYLFDGNSVGIGRKGTIDKPVYLEGKFWTVDTLFFTYSFIDVLPKFIYFLFLGINWKKYNEASGVPSLSKATIEKIDISIPCIQEQTKITNFLSAIDTKIKLVNTQLENTLQFKKGLLQQMFV